MYASTEQECIRRDIEDIVNWRDTLQEYNEYQKNHQYHKSIRQLALRDMATLIYPDHRELFHRQGENIHKFLLAHTSEAHTGRGLQTGIHPGQHKLQRVPFAGKTAFLQNGGRKKGTKKRPPNGLRQRQATLRLPVLYVLLEHNQQLLY